MSDNSANAHETSMEDILASIRRIIDEEDTRDGRPSSESAFSDEDDAREVDTTMPVMAPAADNRDQSADDAEAEGEEAIFPERESLFWSRATGRGAPIPGSQDEDGEASSDGGTSGGAVAGVAAAATAGAAVVGGSATDIFTRAQNKLGSTSRLSARERMQSLAARTANRADDAAEEASDSVADMADIADLSDDTLPDFSVGAAGDGAADVLELTDAMESNADEAVQSVIARAGENVSSVAEDAESKIADADYATAFDPVDTDGDATGERDVATGSTDRDDDVFDLTTPLTKQDGDEGVAAETTESVVADVTDEIEDDIAASLSEEAADLSPEEPGERLEDEYSARFYGESATARAEASDAVEGVEADETADRAAGEGETVGDTQDTAEADAASDADDAVAGDDAVVHDDREGDDGVAYGQTSSDDAHMDDDEPASDEAEGGYGAFATTAAAGVAAGAASSFYGTDDDDEQKADDDEGLGFSDTFSASDVYHDDPPALDDDYSASLDREDEPVIARSAFAGEDAFDDAPANHLDRDEGMETVGGLVRDAMERDPVDYADPSALVSMSSEEISARALASLADVEGEATRRMYGALKISEGGESESIEGMVKGMLKPMLREWLDDNLPNMVETMVRGEVERISAKSRRYSRASDED